MAEMGAHRCLQQLTTSTRLPGRLIVEHERGCVTEFFSARAEYAL